MMSFSMMTATDEVRSNTAGGNSSVISNDDNSLLNKTARTAATPPAKGGSKSDNKKSNWKKPEDMPRRPLSAYNMFFQLRREYILEKSSQGQSMEEPLDIPSFTDAQVEVLVQKHNQKLSQDPKQRKRKHCKTHGKIGFAQLARMIAKDWKRVDPASKKMFEEHAAREKGLYRQRIADWEQKKKLEEQNKVQSNAAADENADEKMTHENSSKASEPMTTDDVTSKKMKNPASKIDALEITPARAPKQSKFVSPASGSVNKSSSSSSSKVDQPLSLASLTSNAHQKKMESLPRTAAAAAAAAASPSQQAPRRQSLKDTLMLPPCPATPSTPINRSRLRMLLDKATSHEFSPNPLPFLDVFTSSQDLQQLQQQVSNQEDKDTTMEDDHHHGNSAAAVGDLTPLHHQHSSSIDHNLLSDLLPSPLPTSTNTPGSAGGRPCVNLNNMSFTPYQLQEFNNNDNNNNSMLNVCDMVDETYNFAQRTTSGCQPSNNNNNDCSNLLMPNEINTATCGPQGTTTNNNNSIHGFGAIPPRMSMMQRRIQQQQQSLSMMMMMNHQQQNNDVFGNGNSFQTTMNDMMSFPQFNPSQSMQDQMMQPQQQQQQNSCFFSSTNDCFVCPDFGQDIDNSIFNNNNNNSTLHQNTNSSNNNNFMFHMQNEQFFQ